MDIALAQTILSQRTAVAYQDAQVSMLKKAMDAESSAAATLVDTMMPLATEGSVGRHVNTYA